MRSLAGVRFLWKEGGPVHLETQLCGGGSIVVMSDNSSPLRKPSVDGWKISSVKKVGVFFGAGVCCEKGKGKKKKLLHGSIDYPTNRKPKSDCSFDSLFCYSYC